MKTTILLIACLLTTAAFTQVHTIKGKVTSQEGDRARSVNVMLKGTTEGTYTDNNGNFIIGTTKALPATLVFTSAEFATQ